MAARCLVSGQYLKGKGMAVEALTMHIHARNLRKCDADPTIWSLFALVVRLAQRQGYHRKWNKVSAKLSPFDAEMRRRVWLFIDSYDVMLSHQQGMPPMIHEDGFDTEIPTNMTDEDFDEDSVQISPRPSSDPLPILAYITKAQLLPTIRRSMMYALGIKSSSWSEASDMRKNLDQWHAAVPPCLQYRPIRESSFTDPNYTVMHRIMLELTYEMAVCTVYRPFFSSAMRLGEDCEHSAAVGFCRTAALRVIEIHIEVEREVQPGGRLYEDRYLVSSIALHDFLMAIMILCIELIESKVMSPEEKADRVKLLRTTHEMWHARADTSLDALHAVRVLRAILNKHEAPPPPPPPPPPNPQCPVSAQNGTPGTGIFNGSHFCKDIEQCQKAPVLSQCEFPAQMVNFDELPALDDAFFSDSTPVLDWSRFNCPLLFTDMGPPGSTLDFEH